MGERAAAAVWGVLWVSSGHGADSSGENREEIWSQRCCREGSSMGFHLGFEFPRSDEEESEGSARELRGLGL